MFIPPENPSYVSYNGVATEKLQVDDFPESPNNDNLLHQPQNQRIKPLSVHTKIFAKTSHLVVENTCFLGRFSPFRGPGSRSAHLLTLNNKKPVSENRYRLFLLKFYRVIDSRDPKV